MSDQDSSIDRLEGAASRLVFDPDAFHFVLDVLHLVMREVVFREGIEKHITALELSHRLCQVAVSEFGPHALTRLRAWKIETTKDFGTIVYSLVELGMAHTDEDDSIDDFRDLFDLEDAISALQDRQRTAPRSSFYQYRLSSMLMITTILAFVFAGYAKGKFVGSMLAVYFAWLTTIALACWWVAIRDRKSHWLPGAVLGTLMIATAAVIFRVLFVG